MTTTALSRTRCKQRNAKPKTEAQGPQVQSQLKQHSDPLSGNLKEGERGVDEERRRREERNKKRMKTENQI